MAPITMDPAILTDAATQYKTVSNSADGVIRVLGETLQANWACAGTDNAGAGWAASYDPAAFDAVAAGTNIVNAFSKLHDLLAATGVNHANTERSNTNPPEPRRGRRRSFRPCPRRRFTGRSAAIPTRRSGGS
ncbi:hypothetical protein [Rhodococcus globerulus]|uniref:hypothetical protein n=1 Tax=Rhodococcus globerulus TaxID=33008 RepID=UPI003018FE62